MLKKKKLGQGQWMDETRKAECWELLKVGGDGYVEIHCTHLYFDVCLEISIIKRIFFKKKKND